MPTDATVLGFSNRWYPVAIDTAETFHIAGHDVRVVTPAVTNGPCIWRGSSTSSAA